MLEIQGITKSFPGVLALDNVQLSVKEGSVHGVLGENGAGKSTLMKILTGSLAPDKGRIHFKGEDIVFKSVQNAEQLGIGIVYQELSLFDNLTVAQNIFAMHELGKYGLLDDKLMEKKADEYLTSLGLKISSERYVYELSIAEKQMIEIVKVMYRSPSLIILDEPTSSIGDKEVEILFNLIKQLQKKKCACVYISHKLNEIFSLCDTLTILRDGKYIDTLVTSETNQDEIVRLMVGRDVVDIYPKRDSEIESDNMLVCDGISHAPYYHDISFALKKGEIMGFYGLIGAGRTEIMKGIFGIHPPQSGTIYLKGKEVAITSPKVAIENNIALVSESRKEDGLVLNFPIKENVSMVNIEHIMNNGFINPSREVEIANTHKEFLKIKCPTTEQIVNNLSGGNQQKVVLAKWFEGNPEIIILDEPTRGIDIGAKSEIYKIIRELSKEGKSILLISSELPEILNLSDRIMLVQHNRIIQEYEASRVDEYDILNQIIDYKGA